MLAGSPLRTISPVVRVTDDASVATASRLTLAQPVALDGKTAHPIDNFDKNERLTLGSFNSLDGRAD